MFTTARTSAKRCPHPVFREVFRWAFILLFVSTGSAARASDVAGGVTFTPDDADLQKGGEGATFRATFTVATNAGDGGGGIRLNVVESDDFGDDHPLNITIQCQPQLPPGTTAKITLSFTLKCTEDCKLTSGTVASLAITDAGGNPLCVNRTVTTSGATTDEEGEHEVAIEDVGDGDNSSARLKIRCQPRAMSTTGWLDPPGPGERLDYKVTARKAPGTAADVQFWLELFNKTDAPVTVIACAMIRLEAPAVSMPQYTISKSNNTWSCQAAGTVDRPPGFHFGCKKVTVPAKDAEGHPGKAAAYDVTRTLAQSFETGDITSVYWDVLEDCPLTPACEALLAAALDRANVNLSPANGDVISNAANIWGGAATPECLDPVTSCASFDLGNWFTMELPGTYPARFVGNIFHAPPGSSFRLELPDQTLEWLTPADGVVDINFPFLVPPEADALAHLTFTPLAPLPEGTVWRFDLDALAEPGNTLWQPGEHMHDVSLTWVQDSVAPEFRRAEVFWPAPDAPLVVDLAAEDATTMAVAASIRVRTPEGFDQTFPVDFAEPAEIDRLTLFQDTVGPIPGAGPVTFDLTVVDENGNQANLSGTVTPSGIAVPALGELGFWLLLVITAMAGVIRLRRQQRLPRPS